MNLPLLNEIDDEVQAQAAQWGDAHDDEHDEVEWQYLLAVHVSRLLNASESSQIAGDYRERLIKIAALCVSAIESFDRTEITKDVPK